MGAPDLAELAGFQPSWACQRVSGLSIDRVLIYPALTIWSLISDTRVSE